MQRKPAGLGRKRPQLNIPVTRLFLDPQNPRLPEQAQGKKEDELLATLYREFSLDELAESMSQNGYFDEEPLVAIPMKVPQKLENADVGSKEFLAFLEDDKTLFTVVEGNRRLATIKLLLNPERRSKYGKKQWPTPSELVRDDLSILPVIVYKKRSDVVAYLGVRHIIGIQKWDSFAKARYIAGMIESGMTISEIEGQIGDHSGTLTRNYISYKLLDQADNEFEFDVKEAKNDFSFLLLAIGQGNIKRFLGLPSKLSDTNPDAPIPETHLENMKDLMVWMFGTEEEKPVINESRDITNYLSHIVASPDAIAYLKAKNDIVGAWDRTDGEEKMVMRYLGTANSKLENVLSVVHRHRTLEVVSQVEMCDETIKAILKVVVE